MTVIMSGVYVKWLFLWLVLTFVPTYVRTYVRKYIRTNLPTVRLSSPRWTRGVSLNCLRSYFFVRAGTESEGMVQKGHAGTWGLGGEIEKYPFLCPVLMYVLFLCPVSSNQLRQKAGGNSAHYSSIRSPTNSVSLDIRHHGTECQYTRSAHALGQCGSTRQRSPTRCPTDRRSNGRTTSRESRAGSDIRHFKVYSRTPHVTHVKVTMVESCSVLRQKGLISPMVWPYFGKQLRRQDPYYKHTWYA